jgi:hypothetical protein
MLLFFVACGQAIGGSIDDASLYGAVAGGASSNISATGFSVEPRSRVGLWAGVFWELTLNKHFGFQPTLSFVQKGYSYGTKAATRLYYIEAPLFFKWRSSRVGFRTYAMGGPAIGYIVQKTTLGEDGRSTLIDDRNTKNIELSLQTAVGCEIPMTKTWAIMLQLGYSMGLNNWVASSNNGTAKNNVFQFGLGFIRSEYEPGEDIEQRAKNYLRDRQEPRSDGGDAPPPPPGNELPIEELPADSPELQESEEQL